MTVEEINHKLLSNDKKMPQDAISLSQLTDWLDKASEDMKKCNNISEVRDWGHGIEIVSDFIKANYAALEAGTSKPLRYRYFSDTGEIELIGLDGERTSCTWNPTSRESAIRFAKDLGLRAEFVGNNDY
jgi:hypothetical protein